MFKIISIILLLLSYINATDVSLTSQNIRSYPLSKDKLGIKANYSIVDNKLDIFNIRDSKVGTATDHGSLGDLDALNFTLSYGLYEHISLFYDLSLENIDYAGETLKNRKHEVFTKLNIYHNPSSIIDTYSSDIGIIHNSASDLSIANSSLAISKMTDLSDSSFYIRFLAGSKIKSSILDFYIGLKYTSINTKIDNLSYDRKEAALNGGFQYTIELGNYLIETGYEYIKLFSRHVDNVDSSNHIFNLTLSRSFSQKFLLFIGSKYYIHQYNGVIPYLYNDRTKDKFSQKFGYATVGFIYNFDMSELKY
jgi:hypothetical protein